MVTPERWALSALLGGAPLQMMAVKLRWALRRLLAGSLRVTWRSRRASSQVAWAWAQQMPMGSQKGPVVEWLCLGLPTRTHSYAVVLGGFKGRQGGAAGCVYSVGVLHLQSALCMFL